MTRNLVVVLVCACSLAAASSSVRVDETGCKILLREAAPVVLLAVDNAATEAASARIALEWLDKAGVARSSKDTLATIYPGRNSIRVPMDLVADSPWYRLRYRVRVADGESTGILSLDQVSDDLFELRILAPFFSRPGDVYEATVQALQPVHRTPVAGVRIRAKVDLDAPVHAMGVTGADGTTHLRFEIPPNAADDGARLKAEGSLPQFSQEAEAYIAFDNHIKIGITTDKPMYQPGQMLHIRALCFTPANRAAAGAKVTFRVEDPEGTRMSVSHGVTTRFGVASADWKIPDNVRLGDYAIVVEIDGEKERKQTSKVKISRYDLPSFTVAVKPDPSYYLPGQEALVEVRADYLFGKPVPRGQVRVVRESRREWNFGEQKLDLTEEEKFEGLTDAMGRFVVRIPLAKMHANLAENHSVRYDDLNFNAAVRDPSSNRTEQRRFDLRVTTRDAAP
jgi:MG2 domain/Macroglobulin domain MG3